MEGIKLLPLCRADAVLFGSLSFSKIVDKLHLIVIQGSILSCDVKWQIASKI